MKKWSKKKKITILLLFLVLLALFAGLCWKKRRGIYNTYMKLTNSGNSLFCKRKTEEKIWLLRSKAECYHGCG